MFAMGILRLPAKLALHVLCSCGAVCSQAQVMYQSVAASVIVFVSLQYLVAANVHAYLPVSRHNQSPSTPASGTTAAVLAAAALSLLSQPAEFGGSAPSKKGKMPRERKPSLLSWMLSCVRWSFFF